MGIFCGVICSLIWVRTIYIYILLITLLVTTHEPPSRAQDFGVYVSFSEDGDWEFRFEYLDTAAFFRQDSRAAEAEQGG